MSEPGTEALAFLEGALVKAGNSLQRRAGGAQAQDLIKNARKLPQEPYTSLTWDQGREMAGHKRFTLAIDIQGYDISRYSQARFNAVPRQLKRKAEKDPRIPDAG